MNPQNKQLHFEIPNLCQTQALLYLVLVSELCVLAWTLAEFSFSWSVFALRSLSVQWVVLLAAALLCQLRRHRFDQWSLRKGWLVSFLLVECIVLSVLAAGQWVLTGAVAPLSLLQKLLASGIITAMVLRFFQLQQQVIAQSQAEANSRMDALQARIRPHFLFNSLNTISELVATKPEDAEAAIASLSVLFRASLAEKSRFCPLKDELQLVKGYLRLEKWRLGDRLQVSWNESVSDMNWPVPVLCLQPLVENAVVHGVAANQAGGKITISVLQTPRITTLIVENSCSQQPSGHRGHGIGQENVRNRLQALYGDAARYRIEQANQQYKVTLTLPKPIKE
ncbi:sensor histidine kinase [Reinekea marinisedimentorum]|uniref:Two-component system sensor histidine kinase AlgZ n=1 Tax=Reinekea marinisedimentorum TaxID=230495 RepID=A0A4R3HZV8_9GAMM|nr:histidine kinase [Reinekea marinisedimentorum]TCS38243.1 two-component system sensor histidine kinase AlgZ [Reinekea marinisedimentorum]